MIRPIARKQGGGDVHLFLRISTTGPAGPFDRREGRPLPPANHWGPSSFIFYWVLPASQLFLRLYYPAVLRTLPPANTAVVIGGFFLPFMEVTYIPPKSKRKKYGPDINSNIVVFLFDLYFLVTTESQRNIFLRGKNSIHN